MYPYISGIWNKKMIMEKSSIKILFWIRKTRLLKNNKTPLLMRITINGQRLELTLSYTVDPKLWDSNKSCVKGNSSKANEINDYLESERLRAYQVYTKMITSGELINLDIFKNILSGNDICKKTLLEILNEHNDNCKLLEGKDYTLSTISRYLTSTRYIAEFINTKYNKKDMYLTELNNIFISDFDLYLKTVKNCQQNSAIKHLKLLKKVVWNSKLLPHKKLSHFINI